MRRVLAFDAIDWLQKVRIGCIYLVNIASNKINNYILELKNTHF